MNRILEKAQRYLMATEWQKLIDCFDSLPEKTQIGKMEMIEKAEELLQTSGVLSEQEPLREAWDFSQEKERLVFCEERDLLIRSFTEADQQAYYLIARQYALSDMKEFFTDGMLLLWQDTMKEYAFYCMVEKAKTPIGYIAIKDTRKKEWELAIELDEHYCCLGYGTQSICLFLNAIQKKAGERVFVAKVEVDNIASQKCMEKIGAQLIGITDGLLRGEAEKEAFESENLDSIDEHMRELAARLGVEPRKLLSHVLKYRIDVVKMT